MPWITAWDSPLNPVRPLPPVGGSPLLHGVEPNEQEASLPLGERVGHTLVLGTTRVGKTRLAEVYITQDIHRPSQEVVIVFDPKGDADLLKRMYVEARRAGREHEFYVFHLGWPEISARYNAIGRFGRISEVATRIAGQLSGEGNSAAFREFAWRFVNIIARALIELGRRPDYLQIQRHVVNIDALFIEYAQHFFARHDPQAWGDHCGSRSSAQREERAAAHDWPRETRGRHRAVPDCQAPFRSSDGWPALGGALRPHLLRQDRRFAAAAAGKAHQRQDGAVAGPNYADLDDPRPIFDWLQVIRKRGIVYVGLDALSDAEVAAAVGNSMFADLVSVAGHIYKHGIDHGLPSSSRAAERCPSTCTPTSSTS